jgi:hypothetical protein
LVVPFEETLVVAPGKPELIELVDVGVLESVPPVREKALRLFWLPQKYT